MPEFSEIALHQLGKIITGRTPSTERPELLGAKAAFITPTDIEEGSIFPQVSRRLSVAGEAEFHRSLLPPRAVCFTCIASIGKMCMTRELSLTNQQINSIVVDQSQFDPRWVFYTLKGMREQIAAIASGSATPIINKTSFGNVRTLAPPLETQRRIAAILGTYDDLIEINRQRMTVLEKMARRLFEEWFVRFRFPGHEGVPIVDTPNGPMPEGWEIKAFGDVAENFDRLRKPLSGKVRQGMQGSYPYYGAAKIFDYIDSYIFEGRHLLVAEDGSVITNDGFPVLQLANGKFWVNNHAHVVRGLGAVSTEFLYLSLCRQPIQGYITGAAQPKITQGNLNRIHVKVGDRKTMTRFNQTVKPVFDLISILGQANDKLTASRDLLLPRLISGQLSVQAATRELEEAA